MAEKDSNTPVTTPAQKPAHALNASAKGPPHDHASAIGAFRQREIRKGELLVTSLNGNPVKSMSDYSWQHNAAAALHGWGGHGVADGHEHHEGKPIELSRDDYKAALLAASSPVVRAAVDVDKDVKFTVDKEPKMVRVAAKQGDVIDLRKLHPKLTTEDLAMAGVSFTADYEPHVPALSKHAAHVKNAEAAKRAAAAPAADDDSHLFAKA